MKYFGGVYMRFYLFLLLLVFYKRNTWKHTQPKVKGIFNYKLNIIVIFERLLINCFHGNCYVVLKYNLTRN